MKTSTAPLARNGPSPKVVDFPRERTGTPNPARAARKHLENATRSLADAVAEQAVVIRKFNRSTEALRDTIRKLETNLVVYKSKVDRLDVRPLGRKARRLARIAASWTQD